MRSQSQLRNDKYIITQYLYDFNFFSINHLHKNCVAMTTSWHYCTKINKIVLHRFMLKIKKFHSLLETLSTHEAKTSGERIKKYDHLKLKHKFLVRLKTSL